jgi:predicted ABC-type ATPase
MKRLIILKGPIGSGKTKAGLNLLEALEDSTLLDLDLNADFIIQSIGEPLRKKNVVREPFHRNSYTNDP